jgi:hypothetical protein
MANRSWVDLNHGRLLWPKLEGYRLLDPKPTEETEKRRSESVKPDEVDEEEEDVHRSPSRAGQAEPVVPDAPHETAETRVKGKRNWFWSRSEPNPEYGHVLPAEPDPEYYPWHPFIRRKLVETVPHPGYDRINPDNHHQHSTGSGSDHAAEVHIDYVSDEQINPITRLPWYAYVLHPSQIPSRYDLRYKGIGIVVDLGLGRNEEAVRQEVGEWKAWEREKEQSKALLTKMTKVPM